MVGRFFCQISRSVEINVIKQKSVKNVCIVAGYGIFGIVSCFIIFTHILRNFTEFGGSIFMFFTNCLLHFVHELRYHFGTTSGFCKFIISIFLGELYESFQVCFSKFWPQDSLGITTGFRNFAIPIFQEIFCCISNIFSNF